MLQASQQQALRQQLTPEALVNEQVTEVHQIQGKRTAHGALLMLMHFNRLWPGPTNVLLNSCSWNQVVLFVVLPLRIRSNASASFCRRWKRSLPAELYLRLPGNVVPLLFVPMIRRSTIQGHVSLCAEDFAIKWSVPCAK